MIKILVEQPVPIRFNYNNLGISQELYQTDLYQSYGKFYKQESN